LAKKTALPLCPGELALRLFLDYITWYLTKKSRQAADRLPVFLVILAEYKKRRRPSLAAFFFLLFLDVNGENGRLEDPWP
jgi:hypothetical protein